MNIFSDAPYCVHQRDMIGMSVGRIVGEKIGLECTFSLCGIYLVQLHYCLLTKWNRSVVGIFLLLECHEHILCTLTSFVIVTAECWVGG